MSTGISTQMAVEVWEDNVGDSGKAPTDKELQTYADAIVELARPDIERMAAVSAMPSELYNELMDFLLNESIYSNKPLYMAEKIKNLFGKSARERVESAL